MVDYWGGRGAKGMLPPPPPLKLLGGGGAWPSWPPSSYAYVTKDVKPPDQLPIRNGGERENGGVTSLESVATQHQLLIVFMDVS